MVDPMPRIRIPREKVVAYRSSGEVDCIRWFRHEPGFTVEFHVNNYPKALRENPDLSLGSRDLEVQGVGRIWISDCPGGVELHDRSPRTPRDAENGPDHDHCMALRGPCWHDGSSMAASKFCETWVGTDAEVWGLLEKWVGYERESREEDQAAAHNATCGEVSDG